MRVGRNEGRITVLAGSLGEPGEITDPAVGIPISCRPPIISNELQIL